MCLLDDCLGDRAAGGGQWVAVGNLGELNSCAVGSGGRRPVSRSVGDVPGLPFHELTSMARRLLLAMSHVCSDGTTRGSCRVCFSGILIPHMYFDST